MAKTTTISIRGTRDYVLAFKAYAFKRQMKMSDLVRDAIDKVYGDVTEDTASFFATDGYCNSQKGKTVTNSSGNEEGA